MARRLFLGPKVKQFRRDLGLTQVAMAKKLGVSPSYLNLIEHNRRSITPDMARRFAEACDIDVELLSGHREARLRDHLQEVLGDEIFADFRLRRVNLEELVAQEPQFCRAVTELYRVFRKSRQDLRVLSEHMADDPTLADASHRFLTTLTSLRSFAEIMRDNADLEEGKRAEFAGILVEESENLTAQVRQLFRFIGEGGLGPDSAGEWPREEVAEALQANNNYFDELENWAEALRGELDGPDGEGAPLTFARLCEMAGEAFGITTRASPCAPRAFDGNSHREPQVWDYDSERKCLALANSLPEESRVFALLKAICLEHHGAGIDGLVGEAQMSSAPAAALYRSALASYFAGAAMMPYERFRRAAQGCLHDLDVLRHTFAVSFEQACHRLATLQRPGAEGVPFHFVRSDIAGNIDKRFSASGLGLPTYGGICPLWNLHGAFLQPGRIVPQLVELPHGGRYFLIARTVTKPKPSHRAPERVFSIGIGCDISFAKQLVYAAGIDLAAAEPMPVGTGCRQCPRTACRHRAFPCAVSFVRPGEGPGDSDAQDALISAPAG
jgi:predicted transcriptional regulator/transcriptional regulator with XRE-family HTH domain